MNDDFDEWIDQAVRTRIETEQSQTAVLAGVQESLMALRQLVGDVRSQTIDVIDLLPTRIDVATDQLTLQSTEAAHALMGATERVGAALEVLAGKVDVPRLADTLSRVETDVAPLRAATAELADSLQRLHRSNGSTDARLDALGERTGWIADRLEQAVSAMSSNNDTTQAILTAARTVTESARQATADLTTHVGNLTDTHRRLDSGVEESASRVAKQVMAGMTLTVDGVVSHLRAVADDVAQGRLGEQQTRNGLLQALEGAQTDLRLTAARLSSDFVDEMTLCRGAIADDRERAAERLRSAAALADDRLKEAADRAAASLSSAARRAEESASGLDDVLRERVEAVAGQIIDAVGGSTDRLADAVHTIIDDIASSTKAERDALDQALRRIDDRLAAAADRIERATGATDELATTTRTAAAHTQELTARIADQAESSSALAVTGDALREAIASGTTSVRVSTGTASATIERAATSLTGELGVATGRHVHTITSASADLSRSVLSAEQVLARATDASQRLTERLDEAARRSSEDSVDVHEAVTDAASSILDALTDVRQAGALSTAEAASMLAARIDDALRTVADAHDHSVQELTSGLADAKGELSRLRTETGAAIEALSRRTDRHLTETKDLVAEVVEASRAQAEETARVVRSVMAEATSSLRADLSGRLAAVTDEIRRDKAEHERVTDDVVVQINSTLQTRLPALLETPTAEQIAVKVITQMPEWPEPPSAEEIAQAMAASGTHRSDGAGTRRELATIRASLDRLLHLADRDRDHDLIVQELVDRALGDLREGAAAAAVSTSRMTRVPDTPVVPSPPS